MSTLKPFAVTVVYAAIVMAESTADAYSVADDHLRDITHDNEADVTVERAIESVDQLSNYGWDGECLPYGVEGNERLKDIIAALPPPRDTKTIDMFEEKKA